MANDRYDGCSFPQKPVKQIFVAMMTLTDFGDLAVLLPVSAAILAWLLAARSPGGAVWWIAAVAMCTLATALLKIYFFACPIGEDLVSPSGHTSFGTLVYGGLMVVVANELRSGWRRIVASCAVASFVVGIAISRFLLGAHSAAEILFGLAVGIISLGIFGQHYLRFPPAQTRLRLLLIVVVVLITIFHGRELHAEVLLRAISGYLHVGSTLCA